MKYDYSKLRGKIREVFGTQDKFAKILEISEATLSKKLNNGSEFTQKEIRIACDCLGIKPCEIPLYFFSFEV